MLFAECTRLEQLQGAHFQGGQFQGDSLSSLAQQKSKEVFEVASMAMLYMMLNEPIGPRQDTLYMADMREFAETDTTIQSNARHTLHMASMREVAEKDTTILSKARHTAHGQHEGSCRPLVVCLRPGSGQHPIHSHCAHPAPPHPALLLQLMSEAHVARHWIAHRCPAFCWMHLALHLMSPGFHLMFLVGQRQHLQMSDGWVGYAVRWQASVSIDEAPTG